MAFAVLASAFMAIVGLQTQSLSTMGRLTQKLEAELWADDTYTRYILRDMGYDIEEIHPLMRDNHPEWTVSVELTPLGLDDLPFVPVLPFGWAADWVDVKIKDGDAVLASFRPLWARPNSVQQGASP